MAVLRQKREFFTQPIGVVRANAGAAQVGESIARSAGRMAQLAYNEAAKRAEKVGRETALAVGSDKIVSLDPQTNNPVAYKPPQGFGGIAAEAYQSMITRRFEDSVNDALKKRAAELSSTAPSADAYKNAMSDFVGQMYEAEGEQTMFSRYISETGESYVESTYATLKKKEQDAARANLIRQEKLNLFIGINDARKQIAAGGDAEELIVNQRARLQNLWDSKSISVSEYTKSIEELQGLQSLQGSSELFSIYGSKSKSEQSQIRMAIQRPDLMRTLPQNLQDLIITAKMSTGTPTLLSALQSYVDTEDSYTTNAADELLTEFYPEISASSSYSDLISKTNTIEDPDVKAEVLGEATAIWIEQSLDAAIKDSNDIDLISNELKQAGQVDYSKIKSITGNDDIANALVNLDQDARKDLITAIEDRRSNLQRIQSGEEQRIEQAFRDDGFALEKSTKIIDDYNSLREKTLNSNLKNKGTIASAIDDLFAREARIRASSLQLSTFQMEEVRDAVNLGNPKGLSADQKKAYDLFRASYVINPSAVRGQMDSVITARKAQSSREVETLMLSSVRSAVENGIYTNKDDMKAYDESMLKGMVLTMGTIEQFPHAVAALQSGVVLPSVQRALESSVNSFNEDDLNGALATFNLLTASEGVMQDGTVRQVDLLRGRISDNAYSLLSAANQIGRMDNIEPLAALIELKNYDGNVEADIKSDLEYNGSFNGILAEYPMSSVYRSEILNVLKMRKVRGTAITSDLIELVVEDYSEGMIKDDNVVGVRIGDKTIYAPSNFGIGVNDIISNRFDLIEALSDAAENELLLNDTPVASMGNQVIGALGRSVFKDLIGTARANIELFTSGYDRNVDMVRRQRIRSGLEELNFQVKYKPIYQSFNEGAPTWQVGYTTLTGEFKSIEIDGQPFLLQAKVEDFASADIRFERRQQLLKSKNTNAPDNVIAEAELKFDASLAHMEPSFFMSNREAVADYAERLGKTEGEVLDMFNEYRYEYLVGSSTAITEGR